MVTQRTRPLVRTAMAATAALSLLVVAGCADDADTSADETQDATADDMENGDMDSDAGSEEPMEGDEEAADADVLGELPSMVGEDIEALGTVAEVYSDVAFTVRALSVPAVLAIMDGDTVPEDLAPGDAVTIQGTVGDAFDPALDATMEMDTALDPYVGEPYLLVDELEVEEG